MDMRHGMTMICKSLNGFLAVSRPVMSGVSPGEQEVEVVCCVQSVFVLPYSQSDVVV